MKTMIDYKMQIGQTACFVLMLFMFTQVAKATHSVEWVKQIMGGLDVTVRPVAVRVDKDDNIIVTGSFSENMPINIAGTTTNGTGNFFVAKLDTAGNVLWMKTETGMDFNYNSLSMEVDGQGNIYIVGQSSRYDTLAINNTVYAAAQDGIFIVKYDGSNGNVLYVKQSLGYEYADFRIRIDRNDNVVVLLRWVSNPFVFDGQALVNPNVQSASYTLLFSLNSSGSINWYQYIGSKGFTSSGLAGGYYHATRSNLAIDSSGYIYVTMGPIDTLFTTDTMLVHSGSIPHRIEKLAVIDNTGKLIRAKMLAMPVTQAPPYHDHLAVKDIKIDKDNNIVIAGVMNGNISFGNTSMHVTPNPTIYPEVDAFFAVFTNNGFCISANKTISAAGDFPYFIQPTSSGYLYSGYSDSLPISYRGNNIPILHNIPATSYLLELDFYGNLRKAHYDAGQEHPIISCGIDSEENIVLLGKFSKETILFGDTLYDDYLLNPSYTQDGFIVKLNISDFVWPGDCNADGLVSATDFFNIGLAYGDSGAVRPNASSQWTGQYCPDWPGVISGKNEKHTDADGNGVIDQYDALPILQNFSNTHNKSKRAEQSQTDPDLYLVANYDSCGLNTLITVDVVATTANTDSLYGITFQIMFNPQLVDTNSISFTYPSSWIGNEGTDLITFRHNDYSSGAVDIAMSRIDQGNKTGTGVIARMFIVTTDNLSGGIAALDFDIDNLSGIRANGNLLPLTYRGDTVVVVSGYSSVSEKELAKRIGVFPNPAQDKIFVHSMSVEIKGLTLINSLGQTVLHQDNVISEMQDISFLERGVYFLRVETSKGSVMKKLVKE